METKTQPFGLRSRLWLEKRIKEREFCNRMGYSKIRDLSIFDHINSLKYFLATPLKNDVTMAKIFVNYPIKIRSVVVGNAARNKHYKDIEEFTAEAESILMINKDTCHLKPF